VIAQFLDWLEPLALIAPWLAILMCRRKPFLGVPSHVQEPPDLVI
jgi:hypothetical protein